jgi:regulator of protease activity HflC (stomatin/prohibitin superfamily)
MEDENDSKLKAFAGGSVLLSVGVGAIIALLWAVSFGYQYYKVFTAEQSGKAELAQAEWNRQIIVRQAQAKKDAAGLEADAEVLRAEGVSKANKIIADGLGGPEGYLRYLYIHMLQESEGKQVIYIPTEASLPILEAGKR